MVKTPVLKSNKLGIHGHLILEFEQAPRVTEI